MTKADVVNCYHSPLSSKVASFVIVTANALVFVFTACRLFPLFWVMLTNWAEIGMTLEAGRKLAYIFGDEEQTCAAHPENIPRHQARNPNSKPINPRPQTHPTWIPPARSREAKRNAYRSYTDPYEID